MEFIFNTANPIMVLIYTILAVAIIILGKNKKSPILPGIYTILSLILLIYNVTKVGNNSTYESIIANAYISIAFDFVLLFLSYISYLWIDDIHAKEKGKKSYDDSLSWFWDKI